VNDRQYLIVLGLCALAFVGGGVTLILASLEMVS
jgi:hypothetical protein